VQATRGENYVVIMPDAEVGKTVEGVMNAAFDAGERCMAGSSVLTIGDAVQVLPSS